MTQFIHDSYTRKALSLVREGKSFFITGKAGTGKTMLLREIVKDQKTRKQVAICAPTGVAAKHAGGVTLHSLLGLPISIYIPGHKLSGLYKLSPEGQEVVRNLDMLIIDEVSMVRCDLMDMIDDVLKHYRKNGKPFGGLQVVLFGDLRQLMPVVPEEDWEKLGKYYKSAYFFSSNVIMNMKMPMLELTTVHRQSDTTFIDLLNDVRDGILTYNEEAILKSRYDKTFEPGRNSQYIRLTTHVHKAKRYNKEKLDLLRGEEYEYKAWIEGIYPKDEFPNDYVLVLKDGSRVMFIANDNLHGRYANGTLGTVTYCDDEYITVKTDDGYSVDVKKSSWDFYKYKINKEKKEVERILLGTFHQYPIQLAWAVTIHKSQGLTFDKVIIDAGKAFTYGQVYVALSRCRSLEGIVLTSKITPEIVMIDPIVIEYTQLVEHVWPEEEEESEYEDRSEDDAFINRYAYKPVGHVFKAHWDSQYYDAWETASQSYYLDKLVEKDGVLNRLCVGAYPSETLPFAVLSDRDYNSIVSFTYYGGATSRMAISTERGTLCFNYKGKKDSSERIEVTGHETYNRPPILRSYDYQRENDTLKIFKHSKLSDSHPSDIKVYSDLGKLILCCDCYKILRNDSYNYDVSIDDGSYKVLQFSLNDGKSRTDEGRMIADKWYQKNHERAKIKKSYEEIPDTRKKARNVLREKQPKPIPYSKTSIEFKILDCLKRGQMMKAKEIADSIGYTRGEVNSKLYGELNRCGFVEQNGSFWKLVIE